MNPDADRFIALATSPLADNAELQLAATDDLRRRISANAPTAETLEAASASLERADRNPRRYGWQTALTVLAVAAFLPIGGHAAWQLNQFAGMNRLLSADTAQRSSGAGPLNQLTATQKLVLLGDRNVFRESDRWKPLWDSAPQNPAYFQEFATSWYRDFKSISPEILKTAARLDPDNAWYAVIDAAAKAKKSVTKKSLGYPSQNPGKRPSFTVTDEAGFARSLELLHQASVKSRLSGNDVKLQQERIGLLPARKDVLSQLPRQVFAASQHCNIIDFRYLADAISVQAGRCAERKDLTGFQQLVADWKWLVSSTAKGGESFIDVLVAKAIFTMPLVELQNAANSLGLSQDAEVFGEWNQQNEDRRKRSRGQHSATKTEELLETKASIMTGLTLPTLARQLKSPPPITDEDLKPARYAEHALFGRAHAMAAWVLLDFCVMAALISLGRSGDPAKQLAKRLKDLLHPSDWIRILSAGVVLPLLWYFIITRLTPLGAREWTMKLTAFMLPGFQLASLTILMLAAIAVTGSRCLAKRAGFLGLKPRQPKLGMIAVVSAALAIPVLGAMHWMGDLATPVFYLGSSLSGAALLWLLWGFFCHALRKPREAALRRATLARIAIPAWLCGMCAMAVLAPLYYAEERHWTQQDRLLEITAEAPSMSRYEWEVTRQLRKELLETMKFTR